MKDRDRERKKEKKSKSSGITRRLLERFTYTFYSIIHPLNLKKDDIFVRLITRSRSPIARDKKTQIITRIKSLAEKVVLSFFAM